MNTGKNTIISPDLLVSKFCGKVQFPHSFGRFSFIGWLCGAESISSVAIPVASTEEEVLGNTAVLGPAQDPTQIFE